MGVENDFSHFPNFSIPLGSDDNGGGNKIDANKWKGHEEKITQLFSLYYDTVNPLVSVYNSLENAFPIGVMNELRDIFLHLSQSLVAESDEMVSHQFEKAQSHLKRAAVDAFKYACMAYAKKYEEFKAAHEEVDLSYVDNGEFLHKLCQLNSLAQKSVHDARMTESSPHEDEAMYKAYENAYNSYFEVYSYIMNSMGAIEKVKLKSSEDRAAERKQHTIDRMIGIIGAIIGVVGIVIGFLV